MKQRRHVGNARELDGEPAFDCAEAHNAGSGIGDEQYVSTRREAEDRRRELVRGQGRCGWCERSDCQGQSDYCDR
ncbi:MAG: hypothetical protein A2Z48_11455 [Actinobacteria bacterium RBG_19FT_COMBO_70_19]|nr:MAG: hypothetical protein A2Z48_11455 [Actinobacteria bacterium RBG_19FT_COMBO_70_19]